jgi:hypothetical protein
MRTRVKTPEDTNQEVAFFKRTASEAWPHLSPREFRDSLGADTPPSYYSNTFGDKLVLGASIAGLVVFGILLVSGKL